MSLFFFFPFPFFFLIGLDVEQYEKREEALKKEEERCVSIFEKVVKYSDPKNDYEFEKELGKGYLCTALSMK